MTTFPYRFVATEGMYAGTTFVYPYPGLVISYDTAEPLTYHRTLTTVAGVPASPLMTLAVGMDDDSYRRFEAIPLGDGTYVSDETEA